MKMPSSLAKCFGIACIVSLGACNSTDPRAGGFYGGLAGITSGSYQQRVDTRRASLGAARRDLRTAESSRSGASARYETAAAAARSAQSSAQRLRSETLALRSEAANLRRARKLDEGQVTRFESRLAGLEREIGRLSTGPSSGACKSVTECKRIETRLRSRITDMNRELDALAAGST